MNNLKDEAIIRCLRDEYGLNVEMITFLPLGADFNTAVYRITTTSRKEYFLKLRDGEFFEASVSVPKYLADSGLKQVIPPLATKTGHLWTDLNSFKVIVYLYVDGHNGVEAKLSDKQWVEFGATMKKFHSANIPSVIAGGIARETFSSKWRETVRTFLRRIKDEVFVEPVAAEVALFLKSKSTQILNLIQRAEELALKLQKQPIEYIVCHGDIHGWNLLIDKYGALYTIDWDTVMFAPKERDLMFIGAGIWDSGRSTAQEESLFYNGYGQAEVNQDAICYYRFERIIQDIGEYCEHIFLSGEGEEDRMQSFEYLQSNFLPNGTIERACQSDKARK